MAWYLPDVNGKEPDFLLCGDDVGLVSFEVKDWALKQIHEANPHQFLVGLGERFWGHGGLWDQTWDIAI